MQEYFKNYKVCMGNIFVTSHNVLEVNAEGYVYLLEHEFDFAQLAEASKKLYVPLNDAVKQRGFTGKAGNSLVVNGIHNGKPVYLILLGLGDFKEGILNVELFRRAIGKLIRMIESHKINSVVIKLPEPTLMGLSYSRLAQEVTSIIYKAQYHFDEFITSPDRKIHWQFDIHLSVPENAVEQVQDGINRGMIIGTAINRARYLCDMPPTRLTPTIFAEKTEALAKQYGLVCTVFNKKQIIEMGMGGLEGVSRGSTEECRFLVLEYHAPQKEAQSIGLVGKGITFDSGGLSLKPAAAMESMKDDMAGAAVVVSTMEVIAQTKPNVHVFAFVPLSENMPSGSAIKPGDVLRFYNGKTAEVLNTDAEGRLILADALSYAAKNFKLDALIDVATLTGMCAHFFGPYYAGLFSQHENLSNKIMAASKSSGDRVWPLPMDEDYRSAVISEIADLSNTGRGDVKSGAITAAFFLDAFVDKIPHAHLDIAGVAFGPVRMPYFRAGATGFGVRLLVDLIMNWSKG